MEGCNELAGYLKTCMHMHKKYANLRYGNNTSLSF